MPSSGDAPNGGRRYTGRVGGTSPWPILVAGGLALSEVGILFGVVPLAVGGLLLFGGSCAGILHEAGYATSPWRPLQAIGGLFVLLGAGVWGVRLPAFTVRAALRAVAVDSVALRGVAICVAGGFLVLGGVVGSRWAAGRAEPFS